MWLQFFLITGKARQLHTYTLTVFNQEKAIKRKTVEQSPFTPRKLTHLLHLVVMETRYLIWWWVLSRRQQALWPSLTHHLPAWLSPWPAEGRDRSIYLNPLCCENQGTISVQKVRLNRLTVLYYLKFPHGIGCLQASSRSLVFYSILADSREEEEAEEKNKIFPVESW